MPFIGKQSTSNSQITNYTTTVGSGGQTNFTVVIEGGDETHVYLNGVLLKETTDYTVSSTQVSLVSPAVENDIVEIKVFRSFALVDAVRASTGGTFSGDVSFGDNNITNVGDIAVDTISSDAGTSIGVTLGTDAGDDFNVGSGKLVVEGDTGNVGIGTATPSKIIETNESDSVSNGAYTPTTLQSSGALFTVSPSTSASGVRGVVKIGDNARLTELVTFRNSFEDGSTFAIKTLSDGTVSEKLRIDSSGNVEVKTGNLVIGTAGKGIDFSINGGNAETLHEYEEGTFTLSIVNYSGGTAPTIAGQNNGSYLNKYVKIGKTIICSMYLSIDFNSNTEVVFSGLPEIADGGGAVTVVHDSSMSKFQLGFGAVLHGTDDFNYFRDSNGTSTGSARIYNIGLTYVTT